jgi:hypothetical protein
MQQRRYLQRFPIFPPASKSHSTAQRKVGALFKAGPRGALGAAYVVDAEASTQVVWMSPSTWRSQRFAWIRLSGIEQAVLLVLWCGGGVWQGRVGCGQADCGFASEHCGSMGLGCEQWRLWAVPALLTLDCCSSSTGSASTITLHICVQTVHMSVCADGQQDADTSRCCGYTLLSGTQILISSQGAVCDLHLM